MGEGVGAEEIRCWEGRGGAELPYMRCQLRDHREKSRQRRVEGWEERQKAEEELQKSLITGERRRPTMQQQMCPTEQKGGK